MTKKTLAASLVNSQEGRSVFIIDGSRSPFLKFTGKPGPFTASDLAVKSGKPLLLRQPFAPDALDEVILGCVGPRPDEVNIARIVALRLGCGNKVPAWTVQRNCASGMQALDSAYRNIVIGRANLVLAGGTEAMSHAAVLFNERMVHWLGDFNQAKTFIDKLTIFTKLRPGFLTPVIGLLKGLTDPVVDLSMGQTAEIIAHRFGVSRQHMDQYAVASHNKLSQAQEAGHLEEIETLYDSKGNVFQRDSGVRPDSSVEKLAALKPVFDKRFGNVTAGNSAQITDGAAWLILASETVVKQYGLQPLGRIVDSEWAALDPAEMGLGPVHAVTPMLQRQRLALADIHNWELNEAFAAQVLACLEAWKDAEYCATELGLDGSFGEISQDRLNVDGGGISLGHPVGATGARIVLHSLKVLQRSQAKFGVATLCIGGGQGGAMLVENLAN